MKKTLLSLGTIATAAAPLATVISCEKKDDIYFFQLTVDYSDTDFSLDIILFHLPIEDTNTQVTNFQQEYLYRIYTKMAEEIQKVAMDKFINRLHFIYSSPTYSDNEDGIIEYDIAIPDTSLSGLEFIVPEHLDDDGVLIEETSFFVSNIANLYEPPILDFVNKQSLLGKYGHEGDETPILYSPETWVTRYFANNYRVEI